MAKSALPQPSRPILPGSGGDSQLAETVNGQVAELASVIDLRVARRIRTRRLRSGMTLQTLAHGIGVAFQQAHKYERGQSRISAGRLFHIAKALGTPITYFFLPDDKAKALDDGAVKSERQGLSRSTDAPGFVRDRRGATATLFAVLLTALFGLAGLGVDVGIWYTLKREYQSAADNAAISGAIEVAQGKGTYDTSGNSTGPATTDVENLAKYAAINNLPSGEASLGIDSSSSGTYPNGCTSPAANNVCVNNPPNLGSKAGNANYVEAILAEPAVSIFPGIVGYSDALTIRTRAVAGYNNIPSCFIGLGSPYGTGNTLSIGGGGNNIDLNILNCAFVSASTDASGTSNTSIYLNGNVTITAGALATSGGFVIKGNSASVTPPIVANVRPQYTDPYCDATEFAAASASCPSGGVQITLSDTSSPWKQGVAQPMPPYGPCGSNTGTNKTFKPGWYGGTCATGGTAPLSFSGGTTTLCPGVYFLDGETTTGNVKGAALLISGNGTTVQLGVAGQTSNGVTCDANGLDGVTFIASCNTVANSSCTAGGGLVIGGQGSNTPTVNLEPPSTNPGCSWLPNGCPGIPKRVFFHQVFGTADTGKGNSSFGTILGTGVDGVIHVPATNITLSGGANFGSCLEMIAAAFLFNGGASLGRVSTCNLQTDNGKIVQLVE